MMERIESRKESTVKDFLEIIFRRKWAVVSIVVVATAIILILNMRGAAIYESSARVLVKRGEQPGVFTRGAQPMTWEEEISSQIEMVKSTIVVDRAQKLMADYMPPGYKTDWMISIGGVNAGVVSTSNVIWVAYTASDPIFCEVAVNSIINAYKQYYQEIRTAPEMEDFFSREMNTMKEELEYWRERKERVEFEWGIVDLDQQQLEIIRTHEVYKRELEEVSRELMEKESIVQRLEDIRDRDMDERSIVTSSLLGVSARETGIEGLRKQLKDFLIKESELSVGFTGEHQELKEVREQINELKNLLDREIESLLYISNTQIEILRSRRQHLGDIVRQIAEEKRTYPEKEVEINRINATLAYLQDNYDRLGEQHMTSKITVASNPEWTVTILNPATYAYRKKTRDYVRMALGPLFSLIVALGFAFFLDNIDHSIKNVAEAEETLKLQVLASFPDKGRE
jgi:uncharacterized protein involved in exopolysaccharide biosynthesis